MDSSQSAIDFVALSLSTRKSPAVQTVVADIENGPWPFEGRQFDAVVVTNYLWRPLIPTLLASVAGGGVLIYETFTEGNGSVGKPSRADFLLHSGELLTLCSELRIVAYEDGFDDGLNGHSPRFIQRIAAVRQLSGDATAPSFRGEPPRYPLT